MAYYIEFPTKDDSRILVEVETKEEDSSHGVVKAGLGEKLKDTLVAAQTPLEEALETVVSQNAQALIQSMKHLSEPPSEVEIIFGLKVTSEVGNFAVAKAGGEANYTIKLVWKS